jgi:tRNA A-37 threonylcarbamoyl transferase component Bud32/membrane-associated phospholipid phosphatase
MAGEMLAHYKVRERLASGGMGEIYIAEDTRLGRRVALKVLPAEAVADAERLQRFQSEARAVAAMNHPNIVTIHGVEAERGIHFIAMELVDGQTLRKLIPQGGLPLPEFFRIAEQLTAAVAVAHQSGITHRDLKPDNVMVTPSGHVKVLDFGLAKLVDEPAEAAFDGPTLIDSGRAPSPHLTEDGALLGTVPYMSPEHVTGRGIDHRSDIFSLGIILYEMLTGERPFQGSTSTSLMSSILKKPPVPVARRRREVPRSIELAIELCLEKDPADRMQQASALHEQLRIARREISSASGVADARTMWPDSRPPSTIVRTVDRARTRLRLHRLPLLILGAVFAVNFIETAIETAVRDRWGVGRELGFHLARAAHWFEGSTTAEAYDAASPVLVYGFSTAYFFAMLVLVFVTGWALARAGREPFRVFAIAIAADYAISLPFFLFFPVPERWAYPESGAILLSDLWAPELIEVFRPISGLDNCFPSFHVSLTVVMVALAFLYRLRFRWSVLWIGLLIVLSTAVLGIHWLTDIFAGLATGILAVSVARLIDRSTRWRAMS